MPAVGSKQGRETPVLLTGFIHPDLVVPFKDLCLERNQALRTDAGGELDLSALSPIGIGRFTGSGFKDGFCFFLGKNFHTLKTRRG